MQQVAEWRSTAGLSHEERQQVFGGARLAEQLALGVVAGVPA
jgi:hypothetical protein